jgi:2-polyprenyl-3-methyl-5-hydroxy-6-metoxy-1,4-benzoquinol methylase
MSVLQSTTPFPNPQSRTQSQPTPANFFDTVQSYQRSFILKAGVELDLFTVISSGNHTVREIAGACHVPERGIRVLCDCLTVMGFLSKSGDRYSVTPDSAMFLDQRSPAYLGSTLKFLLDPEQIAKMQKLTETVRNGKPAEDCFTFNPEDRLWVEFARGMAPLMVPPARSIAKLLRPGLAAKPSAKVLDIAAGHGTFGITLAEQLHNVQVYAIDWPNVLEVARENAVSSGVSSRYHLLPGSAFEVDWGTGYDAVLMTNFLHHFNASIATSLLKKAHAALNPGGQLAVLEFVPNEDRVSPPIPAMFSMVMFSTTPEGDAYTFGQLSQMCRLAGFEEPKLTQLDASPESVITANKP